MKVHEIITEAIYNTPEYSLSSREDQHKAFTSRLPDLNDDELKKYKLDDYPKTVTVTVKKKDIKVNVTRGEFGTLKIVGTKPTGVNINNVYNSPEAIEYRKKYQEVIRKRNEEFEKKLQIDLHEKLPPAAKLALNDNILQYIHEKDFVHLHKWFEKNGFFTKGPNGTELPIPEVSEFKKMNSLGGWVISTKEIGRSRGVDGRSYVINWKDRCFETESWSSGD